MSDVIDIVTPRKYRNLLSDSEAEPFLKEVLEEVKKNGKPITVKDLKKTAEAMLKERYGF